ncbi:MULTISPECIES: hypothetical protein [Serratia]|uniref:hypothetical protein n=1 Tax=Serratia TaxID=613 RepID=UPI0013DA1589|nr:MULTISPECIES: hypothetical protein [Serratia]MCP1106685.1 hypothetical protein [Serratia nevei]HBH7048717.1 hypothetical protein [Serratia marcescens]HEJ6948201.1 hypothetical protein [Serratia marcescens]HEJ9124653.1 hypothetical protein [Serratia marcescens]
MKITMEHIRAGGGCAWGLRTFFARYQLDLEAFLREGGIDSEKFLATGDALAINIVRLAEKNEEDQ